MHVGFAASPSFVDIGGDHPVSIRLKIAEAQVFQFPLDLPDTQTIRQRRENIQRFLRDHALLFGGHVTERAHVVQAIRQLNDDHAHVVAHRQRHLADVFQFLVEVPPALVQFRLDRQVFQFGHAVYNIGNRRAKFTAQFLAGDVGIFDQVVHQRRSNRLSVEMHLGEDVRYRDAVGEVRFARLTELPCVCRFCLRVGTLDQGTVIGRKFRERVEQRLQIHGYDGGLIHCYHPQR